MSNTKKTTAKKKSSKPKSAAPKKKSVPKVRNVEIKIPDQEFKALIADTFKQVQADDFKLTETTKKSFLKKIKSWFKFS